MLPQFILTVTAARVGSMVLLPNTFVTPRSLPSCGDAADDHELDKLSGVLVNVRPPQIPYTDRPRLSLVNCIEWCNPRGTVIDIAPLEMV